MCLLVVVDMDMRQPGLVEPDAMPRFFLGQPSPVAVQVEIVMIGPTSRPGLLVFAGFHCRVGFLADGLAVPMHIPLTSVRIQHWIDDHQGISQPLFGPCVVGPHQLIQGHHRRFAARGLVAMHVVAEPDDGGRVFGGRSLQQPGPFQVVDPDLLFPGEVPVRRDGDDHQLPPFVGGSVPSPLHHRGGSRHLLEITRHLVVGRPSIPKLIPQVFGRRRHRFLGRRRSR